MRLHAACYTVNLSLWFTFVYIATLKRYMFLSLLNWLLSTCLRGRVLFVLDYLLTHVLTCSRACVLCVFTWLRARILTFPRACELCVLTHCKCLLCFNVLRVCVLVFWYTRFCCLLSLFLYSLFNDDNVQSKN